MVMATVAGVASTPVALRAVTVTVTASVVAVFGVPVMVQLLVLLVRPMARPAGRLVAVQPRLGVASSASSAPPPPLVKLMVAAVPTTRVVAAALAKFGTAGGVTGTVGVSVPLLPQEASTNDIATAADRVIPLWAWFDTGRLKELIFLKV